MRFPRKREVEAVRSSGVDFEVFAEVLDDQDIGVERFEEIVVGGGADEGVLGAAQGAADSGGDVRCREAIEGGAELVGENDGGLVRCGVPAREVEGLGESEAVALAVAELGRGAKHDERITEADETEKRGDAGQIEVFEGVDERHVGQGREGVEVDHREVLPAAQLGDEREDGGLTAAGGTGDEDDAAGWQGDLTSADDVEPAGFIDAEAEHRGGPADAR